MLIKYYKRKYFKKFNFNLFITLLKLFNYLSIRLYLISYSVTLFFFHLYIINLKKRKFYSLNNKHTGKTH